MPFKVSRSMQQYILARIYHEFIQKGDYTLFTAYFWTPILKAIVFIVSFVNSNKISDVKSS